VRRRFARFKLCAHVLDLRCLLVQTRRHSFHSFLLLRDLPAEIESSDYTRLSRRLELALCKDAQERST
jgi:hypothetical protein